tara:strand:+ start:12544 stop:13698 length:1155 start_codon:yes stop_codon:yes gene_type:complete
MIYYLIIFTSIALLFIELSHRLKPCSPLLLTPYKWNINRENKHISINGLLRIDNPHNRIEVMIPSLSIKVVPIGCNKNNKIQISTQLITKHNDQKSREDNYWSAYIVKSKNSTNVEVKIDLTNDSYNANEIKLQALWIEINWVNYGPFGQLECIDGFVIPINDSININSKQWKELNNGIKVLPIKTHILGRLDNPYDLLKNYSKSSIKHGDILTIGETPLAIMQGRYIFPSTLKTNIITRLLCKGFHPTSSLATACGMQSLINLVGPSRVIFAWLIAAFLKIFGIKGTFYRLAGSQARLIDDITGTTPPYDQTIVLGPINSNLFCERASRELGIDVAVVDVNDLGKVKVLASSQNCDEKILSQALISNPAGNANQHTPIVLVRP